MTREEVQAVFVSLLNDNRYKYKNKCFWDLYDSKH